MGVRTRIGIASLLRTLHGGSVEFPEEITFHCPQCGTPCGDKGDCRLVLNAIPNLETTRFEVILQVDCRVCGCDGEPPVMPDGF